MTEVEKCDINVTLVNGQKMQCELKGSVKMKLHDGQTVKLTEVLYVSQAVKNILSVSRLVLNGDTMRGTQRKMIINKNGVIMTLDTRKVQNKNMMFYLKAKRYPPEGQEALTNLPEKKMETSDKK